jgi:hypothetical protein
MSIRTTANFPAPGRQEWSVAIADDELGDGELTLDYGPQRQFRELRLPEALLSDENLARLTERWPTYKAMADAALNVEASRVVAYSEKLRAQGQGRAGLSRDFLRQVIAEKATHEREGRRPITSLAREHEVTRSTVYRWLKAAEKQGIR